MPKLFSMTQSYLSFKKTSRKVALAPNSVLSFSSRYVFEPLSDVQVVRDPLGRIIHLVNHSNRVLYVSLSLSV